MKTMLLASVLVASIIIGPASAADCVYDGTVPGTTSTVYDIGYFHLEDRDVLDADEDGQAGGIFLYLESGASAGLQRDAKSVAFDFIVDNTYVGTLFQSGPIQVGPFTILPDGVVGGGRKMSEETGQVDACGTNTGNSDLLLVAMQRPPRVIG